MDLYCSAVIIEPDQLKHLIRVDDFVCAGDEWLKMAEETGANFAFLLDVDNISLWIQA